MSPYNVKFIPRHVFNVCSLPISEVTHLCCHRCGTNAPCMAPEERAVIEAACRYRDGDGLHNEMYSGLRDSVDALRESQKPAPKWGVYVIQGLTSGTHYRVGQFEDESSGHLNTDDKDQADRWCSALNAREP